MNLNTPPSSYTAICIDHLCFPARIGILDHERTAPQKLCVSMRLYTSINYLNTVTPETLIDYGVIADNILALGQDDHIDLLETLMMRLLKIVFGYSAVTHADITLSKPDIIAQASGVGIQTQISRKDYETTCV